MPFLIGLLCLACNTVTAGEAYKNFPGAPADDRMLQAQDRVEELYERGEYARAMMICKGDLAPKGDKFAQYTIGYMYLFGQGVERDPARALAWYRLAAERGNPALVQVRDELFAQLSPQQIAESNRVFTEIWQEMGDNQILLRLIRADLDTLRARTGTRIPGATSGPLTVIGVPGASAEGFYRAVHERLKTRLAYIKSNVEINDIDQGDGETFVRGLEADLETEVASLDLP